jgi:hypothetical protein
MCFRHPERSEGSRAKRLRQPQERPARFFPFGFAQGFGSITAAFAQNDEEKDRKKEPGFFASL